MTRVVIIGFGHHAQRIYFPIIQKLKGEVEIVAIIDLQSKNRQIDSFLQINDFHPSKLLLGSTEPKHALRQIDKYTATLTIDAVIISTPPEYHYLYSDWALKNGYHILLDKPVSANAGAAYDVKAATKIHTDFTRLIKTLNKARQHKPHLIFDVHCQRRSHLAFKKVKEILEEVYKKTNCPITYYYAFHNDGQWRLPMEMHQLEYHGYKNGTGKASHSGYHFYDLLNWFTDFYRQDVGIDRIRVHAYPNFPQNVIKQINPSVLKKVFKRTIKGDYKFDGYGEVDVCSTIELLSGKDVITHAQVDLLHSGISSRSWENIGNRDLYKGNGRLRHEQHYIVMGPFLTISLTSWQGKPFGTEKVNAPQIYLPGHEFNLDIKVFRNTKIIGGKAIESIQLSDIYSPSLLNYSRGHQEDARKKVIEDFFEAIRQKKPTTSSFETHELSNKIMSTVYESIASKDLVNSRIN